MYNYRGVKTFRFVTSGVELTGWNILGGAELVGLPDWLSTTVIAVILVSALLLTLVVLLVVLRRSRMTLLAAEEEVKEIRETSSRRFRRLEQDVSFMREFFQVIASLLGEMHAERQLRMIPQALLNAIVQIYRPEVAAVLVKRKPRRNDPYTGERLSVAALHSIRGTIREGLEFRFGEGQVGIVAKRQRVMVRKDFEEDQLCMYERDRVTSEPTWDIVAPMVVGDKTLGVLAIARPERHHDTERDVLEMIARIGALTTQNVEAYRKKEVEAEHDKLTNIFNKGALLKRLDQAIIKARKTRGKVSVFMFDLDNFKIFNDTNGHLAGDELLAKLAQLVKETVRSDDVFGRFGGEEFLLVMPGRSVVQAMAAAGMVRKRIEEYPFEGGSTQPLGKVTISGGVACYPDDALDSVLLLRLADVALYKAKRGGRNQVMRAEEAGLNPI
jgi:diguanylate cyclase (GGDEF)-like protein